MKKGVNLWSFPDNMTLKEIFQLAQHAGFDGVELNLEESAPQSQQQNSSNSITIPTLDSTEDDIRKIVHLAKQYELDISSLSSGLFWKYSLTSNDDKDREFAKQIVRKMIDVANWLEADTILVVPGTVDIPWLPNFQPIHYQQAYDRSFSAINELKHYAEEKKINIALENVWNKFLLSPLEMRDFVDKINSKYVGIYFDVGNILLTGFPDQWINILDSRIKSIHVKDFKKIAMGMGVMVGLLQGDVHWKQVISALREIHYDGYLIAELNPYKFGGERMIYDTSQAIETIIHL